MKFYFAYGSNMWDLQMKSRCPCSKKVGVARILGYRWIISTRGYANIVESKEDYVEGVLFEISPTDEIALDRFEGVASGSYGKFELTVHCLQKELVALVYIDPVVAEGAPKKEYIQRINAGLEDAKMSEAYVSRYVKRFIPQ